MDEGEAEADGNGSKASGSTLVGRTHDDEQEDCDENDQCDHGETVVQEFGDNRPHWALHLLFGEDIHLFFGAEEETAQPPEARILFLFGILGHIK